MDYMNAPQQYYPNVGTTTTNVQNYTSNTIPNANYNIPNVSNVQSFGHGSTPNSSNVQNYENLYTATPTPQQVYQSYANPNINLATLQNSISRDNPSNSTSRPSRHPVKTYTRIITTEFPPSHLFPAPGVLLQKAIDEYQKTHKDHILTTSALPPPTPRPVITSQPTTPKSSAPATPAEPAEPPPPVYAPAPRSFPEQAYQYMWWQVVDPNKQQQQQQQIEEQAPLTPELSFMQKKSFRATGGSVTLQLVFLTLQYPISVPASSTIGSVKGRISSMFNIPVEEIKLYSLGQPLQDSNHIQLMGLTDGSLLDMKLESQSLGSPKLQHAFPVTITTNGQAVTTVTVKGADTVVHLKYCVCQSLGGQLYPGWVRLFLYDGRELKTGVVPGTAEEYYFTLWSQLVRGPCSIQMLEPNPGPHPQDGQVPVYVRTQSGKTIQIRINASDTIYDVKLKIMATEDLTPEEQRLIFSGKVLDDGLKVSDYTIQKDATMHLVQKPLN